MYTLPTVLNLFPSSSIILSVNNSFCLNDWNSMSVTPLVSGAIPLFSTLSTFTSSSRESFQPPVRCPIFVCSLIFHPLSLLWVKSCISLLTPPFLIFSPQLVGFATDSIECLFIFLSLSGGGLMKTSFCTTSIAGTASAVPTPQDFPGPFDLFFIDLFCIFSNLPSIVICV